MAIEGTANGLRQQVSDNSRRIDDLEKRMNDVRPEVMVERMNTLHDRMDFIVRLLFWALTAFLGAAIAFAVWALQLAQHP